MQREATREVLKRTGGSRVNIADPCIEFLLHSAAGSLVCDGKDLNCAANPGTGLDRNSLLVFDVDRGQKPDASTQPYTVVVPRMGRPGEKRKIGTDVSHTLNVKLGQFPVLQVMSAVSIASIASWKSHKEPAVSFRSISNTLQQVVDQVCGFATRPLLVLLASTMLL